MLQVVRVVENMSEHPIAAAVVQYVDEQQQQSPRPLTISDFAASPGM